MSVYDKLASAYRVSCPIVSLTTSDPARSVEAIGAALNKVDTDDKGKPKKNQRTAVVIEWDCVRGLSIGPQPQHPTAQKALSQLTSDEYLPAQLTNAIEKLPEACVLVIHNAHRQLDKVEVVQAIWLCRDKFKANRRMLILLGTSIRIPAELQHDCIELDEPLPSVAELSQKVASVCPESVRPAGQDLTDAAEACVGMSAFAAEQLTALNLSKDGLSTAGVWGDKCRKINETPGLKVVSSQANFSSVAGVDQIKGFLGKILNSPKGPNCIVFIDEIEKSLSGAMGDTSGVSGDQLGVLLQWMQDKRADGAILVGAPGAAKSAIAKAAGGECGKPTIQIDLGAMKGSLVGESETRIREALKVIDSISGGKTLWLATSNNISNLPPELKRRFRFGTWFFDLPTKVERASIWALYTAKYNLPAASEEMLDKEWTGAEIESCCEICDKTGLSLEEAADYIVPVSIQGADQIDRLRTAADGKFLSASVAGPYRKATQPTPEVGSNTRHIEL